ncbi:MAG: hypothetical protein Q9170_008341, partial [Blastenia crenularia]
MANYHTFTITDALGDGIQRALPSFPAILLPREPRFVDSDGLDPPSPPSTLTEISNNYIPPSFASPTV